MRVHLTGGLPWHTNEHVAVPAHLLCLGNNPGRTQTLALPHPVTSSPLILRLPAGAIKAQCAARNLQPTPYFIMKTIQLYEMIVVRHGLMTVGQPFSGKSASLNVLAAALTDLCEQGG